MAIPRLLPVISLLQRSADGEEWHFRVAGSEIERRWGRNFTGLDYLGIDIVSPQRIRLTALCCRRTMKSA